MLQTSLLQLLQDDRWVSLKPQRKAALNSPALCIYALSHAYHHLSGHIPSPGMSQTRGSLQTEHLRLHPSSLPQYQVTPYPRRMHNLHATSHAHMILARGAATVPAAQHYRSGRAACLIKAAHAANPTALPWSLETAWTPGSHLLPIAGSSKHRLLHGPVSSW
jgi:hypothetical protein